MMHLHSLLSCSYPVVSVRFRGMFAFCTWETHTPPPSLKYFVIKHVFFYVFMLWTICLTELWVLCSSVTASVAHSLLWRILNWGRDHYRRISSKFLNRPNPPWGLRLDDWNENILQDLQPILKGLSSIVSGFNFWLSLLQLSVTWTHQTSFNWGQKTNNWRFGSSGRVLLCCDLNTQCCGGLTSFCLLLSSHIAVRLMRISGGHY